MAWALHILIIMICYQNVHNTNKKNRTRIKTWWWGNATLMQFVNAWNHLLVRVYCIWESGTSSNKTVLRSCIISLKQVLWIGDRLNNVNIKLYSSLAEKMHMHIAPNYMYDYKCIYLEGWQIKELFDIQSKNSFFVNWILRR